MADRTRLERPVIGPEMPSPNGEASLGSLLRQLADDSRALIRQEVALAKVELQESVRTVTRSAAIVVLGIALAAVGLLVLTAFLVIGLGVLLDDRYWLSSLLVGVGFLLIGGITALAGKRGLAADQLKPDQTVESIRENTEWARTEAQQLKRDLAT